MGQKLYNANDGLVGGRDPFALDLVEQRAAEDRRAFVEGREPDYENMDVTAGIQLNSAAQMLSAETVNRPDSDVTFAQAQELKYNAAVQSEDIPLKPAAELPDEPEEPEEPDEPGNKPPETPGHGPGGPHDSTEEEGTDLFNQE